MISTTVTLKIPGGLHLRPAERLCSRAMRFSSDIELGVRDSRYNAKSVLSVLGACIRCGDSFEISCTGIDEVDALKDLAAFVENEL